MFANSNQCWYPTLTSLIKSSNFTIFVPIQMKMSASTTTEVATTTVLTLMEVMFAPALAATSLTVMDTHVKVGTGK